MRLIGTWTQWFTVFVMALLRWEDGVHGNIRGTDCARTRVADDHIHFSSLWANDHVVLKNHSSCCEIFVLRLGQFDVEVLLFCRKRLPVKSR
jgi:hypothetical protein